MEYLLDRALIGGECVHHLDGNTFNNDFSKILNVEPKKFNYKGDNVKNIGYIAEDFDRIGLNELVVYDKFGRPDAISYDKISLYLIEVVKDQQKQIELLKEEVCKLNPKSEVCN